MCCETCGSNDYKCGCELITSMDGIKPITEDYVHKDDLRKISEDMRKEEFRYLDMNYGALRTEVTLWRKRIDKLLEED